MIHGSVDDRLQARIPILLVHENTSAVRADAIIDTGFTGFLTLPRKLIEQLGLESLGAREARLGDGQVVVFSVYSATVNWHGDQRQVVALESEAGSLVGMAMLSGSRLLINALPKGDVSVEPLQTA